MGYQYIPVKSPGLRPLMRITNVSTIVANAALTTTMGDIPSHDLSKGTISYTLRFHDSNIELYILVLSRGMLLLLL
jgi:hypothetical protein